MKWEGEFLPSEKLSEAETVSLTLPYRNRELAPFKLLLENIKNQTIPFHEVKVVDFSSHEPYRSEMKELCLNNNIDYIFLECNAPDKAIDIFLWTTAVNHGIRQCTGDLIIDSGIDKILETNIAEGMLFHYNRLLKKSGKESFFHTGSYRMKSVPNINELKDFDKLTKKGKFSRPNAYAYICASRKWWCKVRGYDESLRWYEDWDLIRRAKQDKLNLIIPSYGGPTRFFPPCRSIHIIDHSSSRRQYPGKEVLKIAKRGKRFIREKDLPIVRNDETWGILTEKKINSAMVLLENDKKDARKNKRKKN